MVSRTCRLRDSLAMQALEPVEHNEDHKWATIDETLLGDTMRSVFESWRANDSRLADIGRQAERDIRSLYHKKRVAMQLLERLRTLASNESHYRQASVARRESAEAHHRSAEPPPGEDPMHHHLQRHHYVHRHPFGHSPEPAPPAPPHAQQQDSHASFVDTHGRTRYRARINDL